jgi:ACS family pantothenate transporter-like MFS transporter
LYIVWNNGSQQQAMGYWLKSFNAKVPPVPGVTFTVPQINYCKSGLPDTPDSG